MLCFADVIVAPCRVAFSVGRSFRDSMGAPWNIGTGVAAEIKEAHHMHVCLARVKSCIVTGRARCLLWRLAALLAVVGLSSKGSAEVLVELKDWCAVLHFAHWHVRMQRG